MKKAIQAKNLSRFLFLLRNCKYTHFTLDKSGFTITSAYRQRDARASGITTARQPTS